MPRSVTSLLTLLLALAAVPQAGAQGTATLQGTVTDASGAVIVGAVVRLEPVAGGPALSGRTDAEGRFAFDRLEAGGYLLTVSSTGMQAFTTAIKEWNALGDVSTSQ